MTRPWHWGIVILSDPSFAGEVPDADPGAPVSANDKGLVVSVRHAQDVARFEGDFDWAEAAVTVRHLAAAPDVDEGRTPIFEGSLATPTRRLWIGDADDEVVLSGLSTASNVRVLAPFDDLDSPDQIWVDVWGADGRASGG